MPSATNILTLLVLGPIIIQRFPRYPLENKNIAIKACKERLIQTGVSLRIIFTLVISICVEEHRELSS